MAATIWKGHLTFGLVSIPVKLFRAARAEKIHMHRLDRQTGSRVRQVFVPRDMPAETAAVTQSGPALVDFKKPLATPEPEPREENRTLPPSEIVHGFEFEKDKYVAFEREELEQIAPKTSPDMQIIEFVRFEEVDPIYLETSYYVAPDKGGEKPYALLFETLKKTGYAALAELVMHRRDQTMILRAGPHGIIAHTLFYEDEVRRENAFRADASLVVPKEMDLAVKLVDALAAKFEPEKLKDKFRERLQTAISSKIESGSISEAPATSKAAPVVDIMAALKESLSKMKKPAASERMAPPQKKKRSGGK
jgi:DNA end-binding protein Ku